MQRNEKQDIIFGLEEWITTGRKDEFMKNRIFISLLLIEIFIVGVYIKIICSETYSSESVQNQMTSREITQQADGIWYADENSGIKKNTIFLYGPYIPLDKGSYTVAVSYEADHNQVMDIYSRSGGKYLFYDNRQIALKKGRNIETVKVRLSQDIEDFEVRLYFSGKGFVKVNDISIVKNKEEQKENLALIFLLLALLDSYIYQKMIWKESNVSKLFPVLAGLITGIAITIRGGVSESVSLIPMLVDECDGIALNQMIASIAILWFYKSQWHLLSEIKHAVIKVLAAVFSICMVIGISLSSNGNLWFLTKNLPQFLIAVIVFIGYYNLFRVCITFLFHWIDLGKFEEFSVKINWKKFARYPFVVSAVAMIVGWLPYIILFFPGSVPWDGLRQIREGAGYATLTNHHPWLVSKFMGLLMKIGQQISDNVGIFLIVITFMIIEILCYSFVCCKIKKYTNNTLIYGFSVLYFSLLPGFGAFAGVAIKDGLNAALVAYFMAIFVECCFKTRQNDLSAKDFVRLGIAAVFVCVTRKNGIYLVLPQCFGLAVWVTKKKQVIGVFILCFSILMVQVITDVKLPEYLGVVKGSEREMLSIPFQQTARYLLYFPEEVTEQERAAIEQVLPFDKVAEAYYPEKSDAVKNKYRTEVGSQELIQYFKAWYAMFTKHPDVYLEATLEGSYGYYYPFRNCNASERYFLYIQPASGGDMYWHYKFSNEIRRQVEAYAELWVKLPVFAQLMNPGSYTWLLLIMTTYLIYRKKTKGIVLLIAPFMNVLICIASPVNGLVRYTLPLMGCMPLLIGGSYNIVRNDC